MFSPKGGEMRKQFICCPECKTEGYIYFEAREDCPERVLKDASSVHHLVSPDCKGEEQMEFDPSDPESALALKRMIDYRSSNPTK